MILGNAPFIAEPYFGHRSRLYDLDLHRNPDAIADIIIESYNHGVRSINLVNDDALIKGFDMALDEGCDKYHITYSSDGQGSLPVFDKEGRYIGLGVGRVMSMYEEFVDSVNIYNIDIETALLPLTLNPAKLLKLNNKGSIEKGKDADLVIMDKNLKITEVFARGKMMIENAQIKIKGTFEGV